MHNALICPNKPDSSIAALTFDDDLATDPSVADALTLCQSLDLEPEDLFDLMDGGWSDDSGDSDILDNDDSTSTGGLL